MSDRTSAGNGDTPESVTPEESAWDIADRKRKQKERNQKFLQVLILGVLGFLAYGLVSWGFGLTLPLVNDLEYHGGFWTSLLLLPAVVIGTIATVAVIYGLFHLLGILRRGDDDSRAVKFMALPLIFAVALTLKSVSWIFPGTLETTWVAASMYAVMATGLLHLVNTLSEGKFLSR